MNAPSRPQGMMAFLVVWAGQVVSLLGTGMTVFALAIWAFETTGQATTLALMGFFSFGPTVLLSPIAGALVDRWNRKLVMMLSDLASGLATIALLLLYATDSLQIWHLYVAGAFSGAFQAFQFPAYSAAVTLMLPKSQYARASGLLSLAESASAIAAPLLAGILLGVIGIAGVMAIDVITFAIAIGALVWVRIPQPARDPDQAQGKGNLWRESLYGFQYIFARPSLLGLQLVLFSTNLIATFAMILMAPMILARTGNDELVLGMVQSAAGFGGVAGGLLLGIWGGPKRRVHGLLWGITLASLGGELLLGVGRELLLWASAAFLGAFFIPILNGSNQAIWQAKVDPGVQGRVFAARRLIAQVTAPLAMALAGPLADGFSSRPSGRRGRLQRLLAGG
ncbi:MAG TPA: MFS transporter, partial [Candidatus Bipolaricaulota bacterium]